MNQAPPVKHLLVLPRLRVQNANAISSPLTHGFPAITAFMGWMWALERKARALGMDVRFQAVGVVCHEHQELSTDDGYVRSFRLTRNPAGKDGSTAAIVEEGRIHLEISLVVAVQSPQWLNDPALAEDMARELGELAQTLRVAGGTVLPSPPSTRWRTQPFALHLAGSVEQQKEVLRKLRRALLPGFALVLRDDLLLLLPCAHRCVCQACACVLLAETPDKRRCPKCREHMERASRVFED